jgi:hypothetical protein
MRINHIVVVTAMVLAVSYSWGQTGGFYGNRKFVEFSFSGCFPLVYSFNKDYYVKSGDGVAEGNDFVNGGYSGLIGIVIQPGVALSFSTGMWYSNVNGPGTLYYFQEGSSEASSALVLHENLDVRTLSFMPIIEFTGKSGLLPMGVSHSIGLGFNTSWVKERAYAFENKYDIYSNGNTIDFNEFMDSVVTVNGPYIDYKERYAGKTIMYALKIRTPISKQLMINYGFRYTLNVKHLLRYNNVSNVNINSYETALKEQLSNNIKAAQLSSIISLNLGITYVF